MNLPLPKYSKQLANQMAPDNSNRNEKTNINNMLPDLVLNMRSFYDFLNMCQLFYLLIDMSLLLIASRRLHKIFATLLIIWSLLL